MRTHTLPLADVERALRALGWDTYGEHTGGGVFCLHAGPGATDEHTNMVYSAILGPLHVADGTDDLALDLADCYVGVKDDDGDEDVEVALSDVGATTADHVAALVAAQITVTLSGTRRALTVAEARQALA